MPFRGGFIEATQLDGEVWVPIRPVCEALGLAWQPQLKKLRAKPWANTCDTFMVSEGDDQRRRFSCVDLRSLPLWLATIEPSRVKPEAREALVAYQREAAEVLFKHFLAAPSPAPAQRAAVELPLWVCASTPLPSRPKRKKYCAAWSPLGGRGALPSTWACRARSLCPPSGASTSAVAPLPSCTRCSRRTSSPRHPPAPPREPQPQKRRSLEAPCLESTRNEATETCHET